MNTAPPHLNDLSARIAHLHDQLHQETDPPRRVSILDELSFHHIFIDVSRARRYAAEALRIASAMGDDHWIMRSCLRMGDAARSASRYALAVRYYDKAWRLLETLPRDRHEKSYARRSIGRIRFETGKTSEALYMLESALELARESEDRREIASTLTVLSSVYIHIGLYGKSLALLREALEIFEGRTFLSGIASVLLEIGRVYSLLEDWEEAFAHCRRGIALYNEIGNKAPEAQGYADLGAMYTTRKEFDRAVCAYDTALELARNTGQKFMEAQICQEMGRIRVLQGRYEDALPFLERSKGLFRSIGNKLGEGYILLEEGAIFVARREWKKAVAVLSQAYGIVSETGFQSYQVRLHKLLAQAYEASGNLHASIEHYKMFIESEGMAMRREVQREIVTYQLRTIRNEKETYRARADRLEREVDSRSKELAALSLRIAQNDELLDQLRRRLADLKRTDRGAAAAVNRILQEISERADRIDAWNAFGQQLQKLDRNFLHNLTEAVPSLTPCELRICSLLRLNLCNKEIAGLLSISGRTIDGHRRNIRKKMGLKETDNLVAALARI